MAPPGTAMPVQTTPDLPPFRPLTDLLREHAQARPAQPAEPAVFAAPGIAADEDFAEEGWDDDE